jgi:hypothetical protein
VEIFEPEAPALAAREQAFIRGLRQGPLRPPLRIHHQCRAARCRSAGFKTPQIHPRQSRRFC